MHASAALSAAPQKSYALDLILKSSTNASGLRLDRKAATWSYGVALVLSVNKISLGYAIGRDEVMGGGKDHWVYQNKIWHGILFSVSL